MAFCRVENDRVIEVWDVSELPPLTQEITDLYIPCDATVKEGYQQTSPGVFEPYVNPNALEELRANVKLSIKKYASNLMADKIAIFEDFDAIGLVAEIWPMMDSTQASVDMIYCKDVYVFAKSELNLANSATQTQLENYDVTARSWP